MGNEREMVTCTAPVNIAVIKYWGKRDVDLVLPLNSSVSVTLSQDQLRARTTVAAGPDFKESRLWLNGREETMDTPRIQNLFKEMRARARAERGSDMNGLLDWKLHICSENNFPTAAGLASSAAGYACLAYSLAQLYKVTGDISDIARRGSGSACRSVYGGFVVWDRGERQDGSDSIARQLYPHTHWPELAIIILVVSDQKKHVGSTEGMQCTVRTSDLLAERVRRLPHNEAAITEAIRDKDFPKFAEITMKDSNQLHAVCLDSYPPITYMTDVSRSIVRLVHAYNHFHKQTKVAYTFDAGPNACLYLLEKDVAMVTALVSHFFPPSFAIGDKFYTGLPVNKVDLAEECRSSICLEVQPGAIQYMLHTRPGPGPQVCDDSEALLGGDGLPLTAANTGAKRKIDCVS